MVSVSDAAIAEFETNGAVCLRQVFSPPWIEKVQRGIAKNLVAPGPYAESLRDGPSEGVYFNDYFNFRSIPEFRAFVFNSPASDIVRQLMRSTSVTFYHEHVLVKEQGALKPTPWHQDQAYYPFNGEQACSIWLPVDDVPMETTLKFVKGSHKTGWYYPRKFATSLNYPVKPNGCAVNDGNVYKNVPDATGIPEEDVLQWSLSVGDCVVFHMKTLHGANGNSTRLNRRILSTRWFGDDVRMADRAWEPSPPYTGTLREGDHPSKDPVLFPSL
ncbi:hypothetical protein BV898_06634 [Hypsibius exemplaris]|uniref:Phytanoyl-CoA dioxygenase n=1 Tax=Hypsibius exemplaris TaxID=2072580 RepID=A0A1W0WW22_HYPEX|nr:hypothetical protein BV898_06634 [Hypsibius exemplaris]